MRLTKEETRLINIPFIECSEEERLIRKRGLNKIKEKEEKKMFYARNKNRTRDKKMNADNILNSTKHPLVVKQKVAKELGLFLIKYGKEKQGLEYYSLFIQYKEEQLGKHHPSILHEYATYNKLIARVNKICKARVENMKNLQQTYSIQKNV